MMFSQWPKSHRIFKRQAKALIRLRICAGWSEPLLVTHTTLLEISCHGSFYPHAFLKKRRGYIVIASVRSSVRPSVRYAISS